MRKKKYAQIMTLIMLLCVFLVSMKISTKAAGTIVTKTLPYHMVDFGKHLDWDGGTKYYIRFENSIKRWNALKPGMIREDSLFVLEDVYVSDYTEKSSTAGEATKSARTIKFNKMVMDGLSAAQRGNVCTHELGYSLGLAHNQKSDVMYMHVSTKYKLSANDKA